MEVSKDSTARAGWTPTEYLLRGRYCEPEAISARLEQLRIEADADAVLLLAYRGQTLFRSLLLVRHRDRGVEAELQKVLVEDLAIRAGDSPPWLALHPGEDDNGSLVKDLRALAPFSKLGSFFERSVRVLAAQPELATAAGDERHPRPAGIFVLVAESHGLDDEAAALAQELLYMVNGSAPVVVHGNLDAERDVQRAIEALRYSPSAAALGLTADRGQDEEEPSIDQLALALLEEALKLTGSSVGNVYFESRDGDYLELVAAERNANPIRSIAVADPGSVVAWVYNRGRPMVINDIRDFQRMPSHGYKAVTDPDEPAYAELAVPILSPSAGRRDRGTIGVLNVEKVKGRDEGYFTYRELTVLRLLANRLSLWRAQGRLAQVARSMAHLTRRNAVPVEALEGAAENPPGLDRIPADAWDAHRVIDETLEHLYQLTPSHSVTVRLIGSDHRSLVRTCAFPHGTLRDSLPEISLRDRDSVHTWVARTGLPCYLANLGARHPFAGYPGLNGRREARAKILSELCLPIFVGDLLVGTLNLESRQRDAYADSLDVSTAICAQIAVALAHARRAHEQAVLSLSMATTASVHELIKCVDELRDLARGDETLLMLAERVSKLIHAGVDEDPEATAETKTILERVLRAHNLLDFFTVRQPRVQLRHRGAHELILRIANAELARNAHAAALRAANPFPLEARWRTTHIGGRQYLSLRIRNKVAHPLRLEARDVLYRAPLRDDTGRLHIGAFTAGALVRSIGGDVYCVEPGPPVFEVALDLPLRPLIESNNSGLEETHAQV